MIPEDGYPLQWPVGWKRAGRHDRSRFGSRSLARARDRLLDELRMMHVPHHSIVVSSNVELRRDGLPYSNRRAPEDPGVAVYFRLRGEPHALACDRWSRVEDNLHAIALHVAALRGMDRWGVGDALRAFTGYRALPPADASSDNGLAWWRVLGFSAKPTSYPTVATRFRDLALSRGQDADVSDLKAARDTAMKELL